MLHYDIKLTSRHYFVLFLSFEYFSFTRINGMSTAAEVHFQRMVCIQGVGTVFLQRARNYTFWALGAIAISVNSYSSVPLRH